METYEINGKEYELEFIEEYQTDGFVVECDVPGISVAFLWYGTEQYNDDLDGVYNYSVIYRVQCGDYRVETIYSDIDEYTWAEFMDSLSPDGYLDIGEFQGSVNTTIVTDIK